MKSYQNNKKKEERDLLKYFSQAFPDFPNGKIIETESPDFVITSNPKRKLGIELTRLTQPKLSNQEFTIAQINSLKKTISSKAQKLFDSRNDYPLYLSIFFNDNIKVTRNDITEVAENIALDVQNHITGSDRKSIFQINIKNPIAEDYVDLIHGIYHPNVKSSYWSSAGGYVVPALSKEYLVHKIESKEDKLPLYRKRKINNFWLIIIADSFERSTSFNIDNQIEAWNIESKFDKIFLFEVMGNNVYTIK